MRVLLVSSVDAAAALRAGGFAGHYDRCATFSLSVAAAAAQAGAVPFDDLNGLLTAEEPRDLFYETLPRFCEWLRYLDQSNGPALNCFEGLPHLDWYFSLYRYVGLREYSGLLLFDRALRRYFSSYSVREIAAYGRPPRGLAVLGADHYLAVLKKICSETDVRLVMLPAESGRSVHQPARAPSLYRRIRAVAGSAKRSVQSWQEARQNRRITRDCSLLFAPPYEARLLTPHIGPVVTWPDTDLGLTLNADRVARPRPRTARQMPTSGVPAAIERDLPHTSMYAQALTGHLRSALAGHDRALHTADWMMRRYTIRRAIWGVPPCFPDSKTLVVDLLRQRAVPVFGVQHGGSYGDQAYDDMHMLTDYVSCDEFFSYRQIDISRAHVPTPHVKPCKIVPVGSLKESVRRQGFGRTGRRRRQKPVGQIDILFPPGVALDVVAGAPVGKGSDLFRWQTEIGRHLDQIAASVVIKPEKGLLANRPYADAVFPFRYFLQSLRHCAVDDSCSFEEALEIYQPKLVILDWFSTTLQECLAHDCDIIQLVDPVCPPKASVRRELETRVYFADDVPALIALVDRFDRGQLVKLRGTGFYDTHVCPPGDAVARTVRYLDSHARELST